MTRARVLRDALAIGLAVGTAGIPFGAVAVAAGLSPAQACALSLLVFTGASQFALVGVLASGGSLLAGTAGALLLGTRNTLYAVRLGGLLGIRARRRYLAAHLTIDETTAMATAAPLELGRTAFWATGAAVFVWWNLTTLLGALGAGAIDSAAFGLDAAVGAAFLALLAPQIRDRVGARVAVAGALLAAAAVPLMPAGAPVLVAALAVLPAAARRR